MGQTNSTTLIYSVIYIPIFLILIIISAIVLVKSKTKAKSYFLVVLIPLCINIIPFSVGIWGICDTISYNNQISDLKNKIENFINDYEYYDEYVNYLYNYQTGDNTVTIDHPRDRLTYYNNDFSTFTDYFSDNYSLFYRSGGYSNSVDYIYFSFYSTINSYINLHIYDYVNPSEISEYNLNDIADSLSKLKNDYENGYIQYYYFVSSGMGMPYSLSITMVVCASISIIINLITFILCLNKKPNQQQYEIQNANTYIQPPVEQLSTKSEQKQEELPALPLKPKWEELDEETKKPYINSAIKNLYEKQLKDEKLELTRQQRALKKDSIDNNEFYIEDLTDEEKELVNTSAQELYNNRTNKSEQKQEELPALPLKPKWEELDEETKKPYINSAIKNLYEKQLKDEKLELTRQQRALKKDSIDNNEFYIEDLTDEEKELVNTSAQELYNNRTNKKAVQKESKNINKNEKLIKKGFKWVLYCFIATKLGTVTSFTGEKSNYDFRYLGFGIKLLVMTLWEGYTINKEDVLNYTITPSSALKERCVITLKNGKKICIELLLNASQKVTLALGAELLKD